MPGLMELFEENKDGIYRVLRFAIPAVVGVVMSLSGSGLVEQTAHESLHRTEDIEARQNADANYRAYIEDNIEIRAKCDAAIEAFHYHRNDEGDYDRMLKACHSVGELEEDP